MANKSYNDIERQLARIEAMGRGLPSSRVSNARRIAREYKSRIRRNSPSAGKEWDSFFRYYREKPDDNYKVDRVTRSGRSDAERYRDELKNTGKIPSSAHPKANAIRKADARTIGDHVKTGETLRVKKVDVGWNGGIEDIHRSRDGRLWANIYWQGDSTDGNDSLLVDDIRRGGASLPATDRHSTVRVTPEMLNRAIQSMADRVEDSENLEYAKKALENRVKPTASSAQSASQDNDEKYSQTKQTAYARARRAKGLVGG